MTFMETDAYFPVFRPSLQCWVFSCGLWFRLTRLGCGWSQFCRSWTLASGSFFRKSKRTMVTVTLNTLNVLFHMLGNRYTFHSNKLKIQNTFKNEPQQTSHSPNLFSFCSRLPNQHLLFYFLSSVLDWNCVLPFRAENHAGSDWEREHRVGPLLHVSKGRLIISSRSNYASVARQGPLEAYWYSVHMIHISIRHQLCQTESKQLVHWVLHSKFLTLDLYIVTVNLNCALINCSTSWSLSQQIRWSVAASVVWNLTSAHVSLLQLDSTVCKEMSVSDTEVSDVTWTDNGTFNLSEGHTPQTENSEGTSVSSTLPADGCTVLIIWNMTANNDYFHCWWFCWLFSWLTNLLCGL